MFCSKCGAQAPDNAVFCPECGNKLGSEVKNIPLATQVPRKEQTVPVYSGSDIKPTPQPGSDYRYTTAGDTVVPYKAGVRGVRALPSLLLAIFSLISFLVIETLILIYQDIAYYAELFGNLDGYLNSFRSVMAFLANSFFDSAFFIFFFLSVLFMLIGSAGYMKRKTVGTVPAAFVMLGLYCLAYSAATPIYLVLSINDIDFRSILFASLYFMVSILLFIASSIVKNGLKSKVFPIIASAHVIMLFLFSFAAFMHSPLNLFNTIINILLALSMLLFVILCKEEKNVNV